MKIVRTCPMCKCIGIMTTTSEKVKDYLDGRISLNSLAPRFNPMEREFLKTGYCSDCQSILFWSAFTSKRIKFEHNNEEEGSDD